jgi:hypothetical protein
MAQACNHLLLPIRQVEKAVWKGNKAQAWPNAILWPTNTYPPNEVTQIIDLLGMKTNLFQVSRPKMPAQAPVPQPWLEPCGMYQFLWLQPGTKGNILQLGLPFHRRWLLGKRKTPWVSHMNCGHVFISPEKEMA